MQEKLKRRKKTPEEKAADPAPLRPAFYDTAPPPDPLRPDWHPSLRPNHATPPRKPIPARRRVNPPPHPCPPVMPVALAAVAAVEVAGEEVQARARQYWPSPEMLRRRLRPLLWPFPGRQKAP